MQQRSSALWRVHWVFAAVGAITLSAWVAHTQDRKPSDTDAQVAQMMVELLERGHITRHKLDDDMAARWFDAFLRELDPTKIYFLQGDIDEFTRQRTQIDDLLQKGDVAFAYRVFDRYQQRVHERLSLVEELLAEPHDFTLQETIATDWDSMQYAGSMEEMRERWRKKVKFDLLRERVGKTLTNPPRTPAAKPDTAKDKDPVEKIRKRYREIVKNIEQLKRGEKLEMYLTSLASSYDPHTNYMSADTLEEFNISMRLHLEGIGARLRSEDGITVVAEVLSGGPASRDGRLKPEDKILAVAQDDGHFEDVVDRKLPDVVKLIRGARGTQVMLRVVPAGKTEPQVYVLKRDRIDIKSQEARGEVVEQGKRADGKPYRIGWIDLDSFYLDVAAANSGKADAKSTTKDVRVILEKFKQQNVDGVVLDLRDNGGGALTEAIKLVGLFIDRGPVVQVKNFQGSVSDYPDNERGTVYDGPLTVLVSRFSASASEIVAGAIHDYERGLVVGDSHTHGKGTVQTVLDIGQHADDNGPNLGALKLTIQQFFRINGESTQNQGVDADIVLPSVYDHMEIGEKFLKNALPASKVRKVSHERLGRVNPDILEQLRKGSEKRRETSPDFKKLAGTIEVVNRRREQKAITLNEAQYRKEVEGGPDGDPAEGPEAAHPPEATDKPGAPVIKRTYYTNEVLDIMTDYIRLSGSLHTAAKI